MLKNSKSYSVEIVDTKAESESILEQKLKFQQHIITAVVVVVSVGFVTVVIAVLAIFIDSQNAQRAEYSRMLDQVSRLVDTLKQKKE